MMRRAMALLLTFGTPADAQNTSTMQVVQITMVKVIFGYKADRDYLDRPVPTTRPAPSRSPRLSLDQMRARTDQKLVIKAER